MADHLGIDGVDGDGALIDSNVERTVNEVGRELRRVKELLHGRRASAEEARAAAEALAVASRATAGQRAAVHELWWSAKERGAAPVLATKLYYLLNGADASIQSLVRRINAPS